MAERMLKSEKGHFFIDGIRSEDRANRLASLIRSPERTANVISHASRSGTSFWHSRKSLFGSE